MRILICTIALGALLWMVTPLPVTAAESQGILKPAEVTALAHNAKTAAEHRKLVRHYTAMAEKHEAEAREHEALALVYTNQPTGQDEKHPMSGETAAHCKFYTEHCRMAAKDMRAMAAAHEEMAKGSHK